MVSNFNYDNQMESLLSSDIIIEEDELSEFRNMDIMVNSVETGIIEAMAEDTENRTNSTKEAAQITEKHIDDILSSIEVIKTYLLSSKDKIHELINGNSDQEINSDYLKNIFKSLYEDQSEVILFTTNIYKNLMRHNMADYLECSDICEKAEIPEELLSKADDEGENNRHFIKLEECCQDFSDGNIKKEEFLTIIQEEEDFLWEVIKGCNSQMIEQGFSKDEISDEMDNIMGSYARGLTYLKLFSYTKDHLMRRKGLENILQSLKNMIIAGNLFNPDTMYEIYESGDLLDVIGYMDPIRQKEWEKLYGGNRPQKNLDKLPKTQPTTQSRANEATKIIRRKMSEEPTQILDRSKLLQGEAGQATSKTTQVADKAQKAGRISRYWQGIKGFFKGVYGGGKSEAKAALSHINRTGGFIIHRVGGAARSHPIAAGVVMGLAIAGGIGYYAYSKFKQ
ncbi:MAG: hypothetical protein ABRQ39_19355 [Candidatus Eremiobacterota bacterium]